MINRLIVLIIITSFLASCTPLYRDLSKYELDSEEKREWKTFKSNDTDFTLKYPAELTVKDSEDLKKTIHLYSTRNHIDGGRFNMLIKPHKGLDAATLDEIDSKLIFGEAYQSNYRRITSGKMEYGNKEAFYHSFTNGSGWSTYQLIYPIKDDGELYMVSFSAGREYFQAGKDKMHKILQTLDFE